MEIQSLMPPLPKTHGFISQTERKLNGVVEQNQTALGLIPGFVYLLLLQFE